MSSSSPESRSASNDFGENTVGKYGIQPYQFEPRVGTVQSDELEALRENTRMWKS